MASGGTVEVVSAQGQSRTVASEVIFARQMTRGSFVSRDGDNNWAVTAQAQGWLDSGDDVYLARHIQANVKFFAELLAGITEETRVADLLDLAKSYGLAWTSSDQVNRRLSWLQSLGLLERWGFSRLVVTALGHEFLAQAELASPDEAMGEAANQGEMGEVLEIPEVDPIVESVLNDLTPTDLAQRRTIIGYIPRGRKAAGAPTLPERQGGIVESARIFLEFLEDGASVDEIFDRATEALSQKKSSFTQSMHTFRNMGLIDLVSFNRYAPTEVSTVVLHPGNEIDLVRYLHSKYRFIGELISLLQETVSVTEMVKVAASDFGCSQIDNSEIRTRLSFLVDAGLVERIDWSRYRATRLGLAIASTLPAEAVVPVGVVNEELGEHLILQP
ncbi:hypothetical protein [Williamsia sp. 1135]|uniref:hypothetical protein n=1 Tax=Williamsia sp. 1135 TaxID=1889262 RepID=UPI000A1071B6|nr:hypothetical protein [Williamsia sp. 1135]ORM38181.1 hypothetical protein BFL43_00945 [Williamsia sp. 1135]